jgi:hypothetical protein
MNYNKNLMSIMLVMREMCDDVGQAGSRGGQCEHATAPSLIPSLLALHCAGRIYSIIHAFIHHC